MRSISSESFLFLFTLKLFVLMGNAYPVIDNEEIVKNNSIKSANVPIEDAVSVTPYTCVYIPSHLDSCKFNGYEKTKGNLRNLAQTLSEKKRRELSKNNTKFYAHSPMHLSGIDKRVNTIIYEIQRCVPSRLPFILPRCTDEDLANKESEIHQLYPFVINGFSKPIYEFPMYNFSTQNRKISKSA
ncbi:uncharacterized protein LOC126849478 [Cataglyphis hispanica]|uniref:uncharacterized protein LOC126849478 n=1 Tax=Cataglyphis hispanica TaxID=1086592 RepID=UPI00217F7E0F|nr:uncharacterized protein LOC126849478 [Cataglyphis hispanica]XP_050447304.1 uncharacterized protein LOC126849478 [Cataglyphis hispanica]XP_050447305.1 uncharacterized protein LOC126849478 [Cataglyphis hispanica]XP_050447307.1 uncharacterized protein LOC126849478 [Cataglyphis hispanica]XP_050447308.1 uncharacterized protein LOC126849478 [Cataglyphis hispanica]XP_050447309.1 uncharacterized protein LOC126849478 [Cataglyphis hispanica]